MRRHFRSLMSGAAIALCMFDAGQAAAQTAPGTQQFPADPVAATSTADPAVATAQESSSGGLEDIIVTAQRRAENIQSVSIAIQAITADGLAKAGIEDVSNLNLAVPGLAFGASGNDAKIALRGANANATFQDNSPVVSVFVDGIYKPRASQQTRSFFDVSRLEVLKGPQGTLYGRNTLAGAINLYTNAANLDGFAGGVTATYSRFNTVRVESYANLPVTDMLAVRIAALVENGDGFIDNDAGPDLGTKDTISVRGSAYWEPSDRFNMTLRVTNIRERGNVGLFSTNGSCRAESELGLTDALGTRLNCANPRRGAAGAPAFNARGKLGVSKDFINDDKLDEFNATLEINAEMSDTIGFKSVTSYTDYDSVLGHDADYSATSHSREWFVENAESYTQELQVASRGSGPFQFTLGGYGSEDKIFFNAPLLRLNRDNQAVRPTVRSADGVLLPIQIATPVIDPRLDVGNPASATREGQSSNTFQYLDVTTLGVFGQGSLEIFPRFRIVGGLRYSSEAKEGINYNGPTSYVGPQFPTIAPATPADFSADPRLATSRTRKTFNKLTYRAAVEFDAAERVLLFANVSTGFLSGALTTAGAITEQQESINYEAGIKSRFFNNRLQVNASVYRTEYSNLATTFQVPNSAGGVNTLQTTGGEINATGVEAIIDLIPVDNFKLTLSGNYLDAEYGRFGVTASGQTYNGSARNRFVNLEGVTPPFSPEFTGAVQASYDLDLGDRGKLTPSVQVYYSSRYSAHGNLPFNPAGIQPAYTKTNLRLAYTTADERLGLEVFGENLENEIINERTQSGGDGIEQTVWGFPRNYGVRLRGKF